MPFEMSDRINLLGGAARSDNPSNGTPTIAAVQAECDAVALQMRDNMQVMLQRDDLLQSLASKSEATSRSAGAFHVSARGARREMQLSAYKTNALIGLVGLAAVTLLLWWLGLLGGGGGSDGEDAGPQLAGPLSSATLSSAVGVATSAAPLTTVSPTPGR